MKRLLLFIVALFGITTMYSQSFSFMGGEIKIQGDSIITITTANKVVDVPVELISKDDSKTIYKGENETHKMRMEFTHVKKNKYLYNNTMVDKFTNLPTEQAPFFVRKED